MNWKEYLTELTITQKLQKKKQMEKVNKVLDVVNKLKQNKRTEIKHPTDDRIIFKVTKFGNNDFDLLISMHGRNTLSKSDLTLAKLKKILTQEI